MEQSRRDREREVRNKLGSGRRLWWAGQLTVLLCVACAGPHREEGVGTSEEKASAVPAAGRSAVLRVHAVNYPLKYFAERTGGEHVKAEFPVPAGVDPAFWRPGPENISAFQGSDRILLNGAGYAHWLGTASLSPSKLVDTSAGFRDRFLQVEGTVTHSHGPEGAHSHGQTAFTTWLDPQLAVEHARAIRDALVEALPERKEDFQSRFQSLEVDLLALDRDLEAAFGSVQEEPLLASHPVYQYLARRYALDLASLYFEPHEDPGEERWRDLRKLLSSRPARWMLWEDEPQEATARKLAELGLGVIVFKPCSNAPEEGDFLSVMKHNLWRVQAALGQPGAAGEQ
jgi:zinc transport system substrate-binding protein